MTRHTTLSPCRTTVMGTNSLWNGSVAVQNLPLPMYESSQLPDHLAVQVSCAGSKWSEKRGS